MPVPVDELPSDHRIALGIRRVGPQQCHVGIAYRTRSGGSFRFLHLAWHHDLRDEDHPSSRYRFGVLEGVPTALHPTIVAQCLRSASFDANRGLPYGFGYSQAKVKLDEAGERLVIEGASGLTCATFVLAILQLGRVKLVDLGTWRELPGDDEWKCGIVRHLYWDKADCSHIRAVFEDTGDIRVRPEQVLGAASELAIPVSFHTAVAAAAGVLEALDSQDPSTTQSP